MPGNRKGGLQTVITIKEKYGSDYYSRIGKIGGSKSGTGGFYWMKQNGMEDKLKLAGSLGGAVSRRGEDKLDHYERIAVKKTVLTNQYNALKAEPSKAELRKQILKQKRELSQLAVSRLSAKYGVKKGWQ